jgi:hypothetical protein
MAGKESKLYIGCSLTQASPEFVEQVEDLKSTLRKDHEVFDFLGLTAGTANDVYRWDIQRCVGQCTLFVAICDHPSIGLGYELGTAVELHHKPTLAVAHEDAKVTRLILGIDDPNFTIERYNDLCQDVPQMVETRLDQIA